MPPEYWGQPREPTPCCAACSRAVRTSCVTAGACSFSFPARSCRQESLPVVATCSPTRPRHRHGERAGSPLLGWGHDGAPFSSWSSGMGFWEGRIWEGVQSTHSPWKNYRKPPPPTPGPWPIVGVISEKAAEPHGFRCRKGSSVIYLQNTITLASG